MVKSTIKQKIGRLGEDIAIKYLENKGFAILGKNYLKKCGEIDIIVQKGRKLHFIEVKSVSRETSSFLATKNHRNVSHETENHRPEDNIHEHKIKRLLKTIQLYLLEMHENEDPDWQLDAITVELDVLNRKAAVKYLENIAF